MAKRKRLTAANPAFLTDQPPAPSGSLAHAPITDVAREASATAAASEMAQTLTHARETGRMVLELRLDQIALDYLVRDRTLLDDTEMEALLASLRARGQQTPIEVAEIAPGQYGLISGWRRCQALMQLHRETGEARFGTVLALGRSPAQASDAYLAMVEENEIRAGLSYYERARIAARAVEQGVFDSDGAALRALYHAASRAKRSKIGSFLGIVRALDGALHFPEALPERAGLHLAKALTGDAKLAARLRKGLAALNPATAAEEQAWLAKALRGPRRPAPEKTAPPQTPSPALWLRDNPDGSVTLGGDGLTDQIRAGLRAWLAENK